jgi:Fe2+ or Zn2+ uptake regulation protein
MRLGCQIIAVRGQHLSADRKERFANYCNNMLYYLIVIAISCKKDWFCMSHDMVAISAQLHASGYRVTPQRQLILDAICALGGHVTADAVYERVHAITPALNRATVYRTLAFLSEQGILNPRVFEDGHLEYELAGPEPHHHLICRACGAEIQIHHDEVEDFFAHIAEEHEFIIESRHLTLFGTCRPCNEAQTK